MLNLSYLVHKIFGETTWLQCKYYKLLFQNYIIKSIEKTSVLKLKYPLKAHDSQLLVH